MKEMQFKQDKRSIKTRRQIKLALLKLVRTKDIEDISITELTAMAGINRNSFYTHYNSVYNILDDLNADIVTTIDDIVSKYTYKEFREDPYPLLHDFSEVIVNNKYFTEYLLFSGSSGELIKKLKETLCERFYKIYVTERGNNHPYVKYMLSFLVGGVFDLYQMWFSNDKDVSIDELTRMTADLLKRGIVVMREINE
ncbi:MAG: TetR/AcrR family transcriptional regulator [Candidatus Borkfalkiaceae bacterium]|nr:TetR/AcrR family transcriptional regulator [Christensenellaceae bacterium]